MYIAVIYEMGVVKTYLNGNLAHTYNGSGAIGDYYSGLNDFRVGGRQWVPQDLLDYQFFDGAIDEVRVWNVARSHEDIVKGKDSFINSPAPGLAGY